MSDPFARLRVEWRDELAAAAGPAPARFGDLAVKLGFVDPALVQECLEEQARSPEHVHIGQILLRKHYLTAKEFVDVLAAQMGGQARVLGKYVLGAELGRGAMGIVYRARDPALKKDVAIKVLVPGPAVDAVRIERFQREAQAAARLRHTHIVGVHDVGEADGLHFIVMDLVEGETLDRWARHADRKPRERVEVMAKIARAMAHAHERGVVHRDLKPGNVLIDAHGEPFITDFGLARMEATHESLTLSGTQLGTPMYMSPEQVRGEPAEARSDVYSMGVMLYELAAGRPPFEAPGLAELFQKILTEDPPTVSVARDLETIVLHAMQKEPTRRYATAGELADDLQRFLDGEPIAARRSSLTYRVRRRIMRNPAAWTAGAVGLVALTVASIFGIQARQEADLGDRALAISRNVERLEASAGAILRRAEALSGRATIDPAPTIEEFDRAAADNPAAGAYRGWLLLMLGRHESGMAELDRAIAAAPDDPYPRLLRARWNLRRFTLETEVPINTVVMFAGRRTVSVTAPVERLGAREALAAALDDLEAMVASPLWGLLEPKPEVRLLGEGMRLFAARRFAEARLRLAEVPDGSDMRIDALILLGTIEMFEENHQSAADRWEEAVTRPPGEAWAWMQARAGEVQYILAAQRWTRKHLPDKELDHALKHFDRALEMEETLSTALQGRAMTLMLRAQLMEEAGDDPIPPLREALGAQAAVLAQAPDNRYSLHNAASCRLKIAAIEGRRGVDSRVDIERVIEAAGMIVKLLPDWVPGYTLRADARVLLASLSTGEEAERRLGEALRDFDRAVEAEPDGVVQRFNRASCRLHLCNLMRLHARWAEIPEPGRAAIEDLSIVIDADPQIAVAVLTRATARVLVATAEEELGRGNALETYREALVDYERAAEQLPTMYEAQLNYSNTLVRIGGHPSVPADEGLGYLTQAVTRYEFMLTKFTDRPDLAVNAGIAYMNRASRHDRLGDAGAAAGDRADALRLYSAAVGINPRFQQALQSRANLCIGSVERGRAIEARDTAELLSMAREDLDRLRDLDPKSALLAEYERRLRALEEF